VPGGPLTSKPTWSNASRAFDHVGFFRPFPWRGMRATADEPLAALIFRRRVETVTIGFLFWLLMLLWLLFGLYWNRSDLRGGNYGIMGGTLLLFVVLFLLGWKAFGFPIQS
jgi:hypothetical protein